jgi:hypothetical protein
MFFEVVIEEGSQIFHSFVLVVVAALLTVVNAELFAGVESQEC